MSGTTICPTGSSDAQSGDLGDHGDFGLPITPPHDSQKNIVKSVQDPRTGVMLGLRGMDGAFDEEPATNPTIIRSLDCGHTWQEIIDLKAEGVIAPYEGEQVTGPLATTWHIPMVFIPGVSPGHWIMFDFASGYYVSEDNGENWSERKYAGLDGGIVEGVSFAHYEGILGVVGSFDTRALPAWHWLEEERIGYVYQHAEDDGLGYLGIKRSLGPNGSLGWQDSIPADSVANGGTGWVWPGAWPVIHGANGRWIVVVDFWAVEDFWEDPEVITPNLRINTSPDMAPGSWEAPRWLVDEDFHFDMYQGTVSTTSSDRGFTFRQGHPRLKFIPNPDHPVGGRWWLMGVQDMLLFSDDNGETWDLSLADHSGPEGNMHPILNWRQTHSLGYRFTTSRVLDIVSDPFNSGRLMAVGVTYDRVGITNRLAVFCCSEDGGDTWGSVGQLPISLDNIGGVGSSAGSDSPAVARHIFTCTGDPVIVPPSEEEYESEYEYEYVEEYEPEYTPEYSQEYLPEDEYEYSPEYDFEYEPDYEYEPLEEYLPEYEPEYIQEYSPEYSPEYEYEVGPEYDYDYEPDYMFEYEPEPEYEPEYVPEYEPSVEHLPGWDPAEFDVEGQQRAFPGAEGWGATALNDSRDLVDADPNNLVIHFVTSLNDSGPGTLRDIIDNEISNSKYDIIVFRVGGTIHITSQLLIRNNHVYIAGQTAPGGGIMIRGGPSHQMRINPRLNVVVRFLRFRHGEGDSDSGGGIITTGSGQMRNIIYDHLSASWGGGSVQIQFATSDPEQTDHFLKGTIQNCLSAEGFANRSFSFRGASGASGHDFREQSFLRNISAVVGHRQPAFRCGDRPTSETAGLEIINNLFYAAKNRYHEANFQAVFDTINNYFDPGPHLSWNSSTRNEWRNYDENNPGSMYSEGNFVHGLGIIDPQLDMWKIQSLSDTIHPDFDRTQDRSRLIDSLFGISEEMSAVDARIHNIDHAGAHEAVNAKGEWFPNRDEVDERILDYVLSRSSEDTPEDAFGMTVYEIHGGWPTLAAGTPPDDTSGNGLPDAWESEYNISDPAEKTNSGYLAIECYINGIHPDTGVRLEAS